ncbi:unnamed protein product [Choristocarpus tenellus]
MLNGVHQLKARSTSARTSISSSTTYVVRQDHHLAHGNMLLLQPFLRDVNASSGYVFLKTGRHDVKPWGRSPRVDGVEVTMRYWDDKKASTAAKMGNRVRESSFLQLILPDM